jgi:hypothetical protein
MARKDQVADAGWGNGTDEFRHRKINRVETRIYPVGQIGSVSNERRFLERIFSGFSKLPWIASFEKVKCGDTTPIL